MNSGYRLNSYGEYRSGQDTPRQGSNYKSGFGEQRQHGGQAGFQKSDSVSDRRGKRRPLGASVDYMYRPVLAVNSSVQNRFLGLALKSGIPITVDTVDGESFIGKVISFDTYTVALECDSKVYLFHKHACKKISCSGVSADKMTKRREGESNNG